MRLKLNCFGVHDRLTNLDCYVVVLQDPEFVPLEAPNTFLIPLVVGVVAGVLIILIGPHLTS